MPYHEPDPAAEAVLDDGPTLTFGHGLVAGAVVALLIVALCLMWWMP